jgi:ABC-2 type transport system ATP-binding protein
LDVAALAVVLGATVTETLPGDYLVGAVPTPALLALITAWLAERDLALGSLRAGRERLEDLFLRLVSDRDEGR